MKRKVAFAVLGFLTVVVGGLYLAVITAVGGPVDWPTLVQLTLLMAPFGSMFALIAEGSR